MPDGDPALSAPSPANGLRSAPDEVWMQVRDDYLGGISAPECCRRHGVGLTALRKRAASEGWRRADQPWSPPARRDPWDEGVMLEERVGGNLDKVEVRELQWIADRRMMRSIMRGDAAEALRWRRVRDMLEVDVQEVDRLIAEDEAQDWAAAHGDLTDEADEAHGAHDAHGVF
jgi:hypothetical protein